MTAEEFTIKPCDNSLKNRWVDFLNLAFAYERNESYAIDFAPSFTPRNLHNGRLLFVNDELVSTGIMTIKDAITPAGSAKIAVIGAIATAQPWRNKGYSKRILEWLIGEAEAAGADGCLLWSDQPAFYARFGFKPVGTHHLYSLAPLALKTPPLKNRLSGTLMEDWDIVAVSRYYEQHTSRVARTTEDWNELALITSCERFSLADENGDTVAYLGCGRGKDMKGVIHEWGGSPKALEELVYRALEMAPQLYWLTNPYLDDPITQSLKKTGASFDSGPMGLFYTCETGKHRKDLAQVLDRLWFWGLDSL